MEFPPSRGLDYSQPVRLGNWFEDAVLQEEQLREYMAKQAKGDLYIQRQKKMLESLLAPTQVSLSVDHFVHFGDKVMVYHTGMSDSDPYYPQVLAANLGDDPLVDLDAQLPPNKSVSAIPISDPTVRTTFVITGIDGELDSYSGRPLTYNEPFELHTTSGTGGNLRMYSTRRTFAEFSDRITHQSVTLVPESSCYTRWRVLALNPKKNLEMEGRRVPANEKVLLNHMFTNQNLALEWMVHFKSAYGREYEVATFTYLDVHKCPTDANHWYFFMTFKATPELSPPNEPVPDELTPAEQTGALAAQEEAVLHPEGQPTTPEGQVFSEKPPSISADIQDPRPPDITPDATREPAPVEDTGPSPSHGACPKCIWQKK